MCSLIFKLLRHQTLEANVSLTEVYKVQLSIKLLLLSDGSKRVWQQDVACSA